MVIIRNKKRKYAVELDDEAAMEIEEKNTIVDKISSKYLLTLINALPEGYRLIFNMFAIEGYSHQEISDELNISVGTSKSNLSRARAILQEKILNIYGEVKIR